MALRLLYLSLWQLFGWLNAARLARAATRGRGAAPTARQPASHLARPSHPRGIEPTPRKGAPTPSPRHARHVAALASSPGQSPLDQAAPPTRSTVADGGAPAPDPADGHGEPNLGVSAHPRGAQSAWVPGRAEHRVAGPPAGRHRSGAAPRGSDLAAVPVRPSRG